MRKLTEDIEIGERIIYNNTILLITDIYESNGEGRCFICTNEKGKESKFNKSCGTYLETIIE